MKDKLEKIAYEQGISVSEVIRSILNEKINVFEESITNMVNEPKAEYKADKPTFLEEMERIAKLNSHIKSPNDLAENLDYYLYVEPYEKLQKKYAKK